MPVVKLPSNKYLQYKKWCNFSKVIYTAILGTEDKFKTRQDKFLLEFSSRWSLNEWFLFEYFTNEENFQCLWIGTTKKNKAIEILLGLGLYAFVVAES